MRVQERRTKGSQVCVNVRKECRPNLSDTKRRKQLSISVWSQGRFWHNDMSSRHHYNTACHTTHVHVGVNLLQARTTKIQEWTMELHDVLQKQQLPRYQTRNILCPASSYGFISVPSMCPFHEERLRNLDLFIVQRLSNHTTEERLRVIQYSVYKEGH